MVSEYCIFVVFWFLTQNFKIIWFLGVHIALMSLDFTLNVVIFTIFTTKMKGMVANIDSSVSDKVQKDVELISNTVTKHCILFGIAMFMNQAFYSIALYGAIVDAWANTRFKNLGYSVRAFENILNVIVLWLLLSINYSKYICLCRCCHQCIGKCCFKNIDSRNMVKNPYLELDNPAGSSSPVLK